ncbi:MAG: zinc ABC transporter substrate-binding protein, partial [Candidatus Omnitrophica bacterium]|nr:zinc ABC transporter substrate-binding protein [Candidatus Omnitrophota bacterium]
IEKNAIYKFAWLMLFASVILTFPADVHAAKINIVATTSIIGDVVRNVTGNAVDLVVLVGPNGDAHEYEPTPAASVDLAKAGVIFENGLGLEHWLDKLYSASGSSARRVVLSKGVPLRVFKDNPQDIDPHVWQNVANVIIFTKNIREAMERVDPVHKDLYEANAYRYIQQLQGLDAWVRKQVAAIPADKRKLVTNHDALGYFAQAYGFQVIGTVIPSATTEAADPSAKETARLLNVVRAQGVHAVFSENIASSKLARALSKEAGVVVAPDLYTDALGPAGSAGETYIKMICYNVELLKKYLK